MNPGHPPFIAAATTEESTFATMTGPQPGSAPGSATESAPAPGDASIAWYVGRDGQQYGPVADAEFRRMLQTGQIQPTDLVWRDGLAEWQPAATIAPPTPAPRPSPAPAAPAQPTPVSTRITEPKTAQAAVIPEQRPDARPESRQDAKVETKPDAQPRKKPRRPAPAKTTLRYKLGTVGRAVAWSAIALFFAATLGAAYFVVSGDKSLMRIATAWIPSFGSERIVTTEPIGGFASTNDATDKALQRSLLWQVLKKNHADWYAERVKEASDAARANKSPTEITTSLMQAVVKLRRQYAGDAASAPITRLKSITALFATNLTRLRAHNVDACFQYISAGESAPAIIALLQAPEHTSALQAQLAATFEGISEGRKTPRIYPQPRQTDFDTLVAALETRGWQKADLQLFADSQKLSQAPPETVCRLVTEWFESQLAIQEPDVQLRLITDSLRPIVAG